MGHGELAAERFSRWFSDDPPWAPRRVSGSAPESLVFLVERGNGRVHPTGHTGVSGAPQGLRAPRGALPFVPLSVDQRWRPRAVRGVVKDLGFLGTSRSRRRRVAEPEVTGKNSGSACPRSCPVQAR